MKKNKNIGMSVAAATVLVAVNVGVFMAAGKGAIAPIDNMALWGAFVALNIASILWAVNMLGLQPLVVSVSYVAGGFLAFQGVRGMTGVSVAEVTTAGATYGAFGALAIGNLTTKVRLAFFNKGQIPFVFIILGLLVIDAVLNSQVTKAGGSVMLNAVGIPFTLAGVVVGLIWSVLNRYGVGKKPSEVLAEMDAQAEAARSGKTEAVKTEKLVIKMPEAALAAEAEPEPAPSIEVIEPIAPAAKAKPAPVVTMPKPVVAEKKEEEFFPLDIDKGEIAESEPEPNILDAIATFETVPAEEESFEPSSFAESLYASGAIESESNGGVMVKEPEVVVEIEPVVAAAKPAPAPEKKKSNDNDFLSGHLDLLNKLK